MKKLILFSTLLFVSNFVHTSEPGRKKSHQGPHNNDDFDECDIGEEGYGNKTSTEQSANWLTCTLKVVRDSAISILPNANMNEIITHDESGTLETHLNALDENQVRTKLNNAVAQALRHGFDKTEQMTSILKRINYGEGVQKQPLMNFVTPELQAQAFELMLKFIQRAVQHLPHLQTQDTDTKFAVTGSHKRTTQAILGAVANTYIDQERPSPTANTANLETNSHGQSRFCL